MSAVARRLGWRAYATDHPQQALSLEQAVLAYREGYLVERGSGRLKGNPNRTPLRQAAESLLKASRLIHLSIVTLGQQAQWQITPLSESQKRILRLLDVSPAIYDRPGAESPKPA